MDESGELGHIIVMFIPSINTKRNKSHFLFYLTSKHFTKTKVIVPLDGIGKLHIQGRMHLYNMWLEVNQYFIPILWQPNANIGYLVVLWHFISYIKLIYSTNIYQVPTTVPVT